jgi:hypothetical protein
MTAWALTNGTPYEPVQIIAGKMANTATTQPGRSCPLHYRYSPNVFARAPDFQTDTLYVIGGLYGNVPALEAVLALAATEPTPVTMAFNGDFNWFNITDADFHAINSEVLRHHALRGNVETEIAHDNGDTGCGCAYPDTVGADEVARSNEIIVKLRDTARRHVDLRQRLAALPMHLVANVGGARVAIVHGDLESLAGWSLSQETLAVEVTKNIVKNHIIKSKCPIVASSHTCLPVALALDTDLGRCAIFNNGAAGMPNFRATQFGLLTRIATTPCTVHPSLYGTRIDNTFVDAVAVNYDKLRWHNEFLKSWPQGSAAHASYLGRITTGPGYDIARAARL